MSRHAAELSWLAVTDGDERPPSELKRWPGYADRL
jgi:hypothetical protein